MHLGFVCGWWHGTRSAPNREIYWAKVDGMQLTLFVLVTHCYTMNIGVCVERKKEFVVQYPPHRPYFLPQILSRPRMGPICKYMGIWIRSQAPLLCIFLQNIIPIALFPILVQCR